MNHLLVDFDSKIPNLALMKISAWAKKKGDIITLIKPDEDFWLIPDKIWLSCIFTWNRENAVAFIEKLKQSYPSAEVRYGGTGFDWGQVNGNRINLPPEIESQMPDYALYADDRAVGFCQRGCDRKCPFCDVWKKEGTIRQNKYQRLTEWVPEGFKKVLLLDNDIALAEKWKHDQVLNDAKDMGIKLSLTQGYDIRVLDPKQDKNAEERASLLAENKPWSTSFNERMLYFSWDRPFYEQMVRNGIQTLLDAGFKSRQLTCYVLVGFDTTHEEDMHRVNVLWKEYGVLPYIMPFNNRKDDEFINRLRRWANKRWLIKSIPFESYDAHHRSTQEYKLGKIGMKMTEVSS